MNKIKKSLELWEKCGEYILLATAYKDNILMEADGCVVRDIDGNEFFDLESGQICSILGHNHPKLIKKLIEQIKKVVHTGTGFVSEAVFDAAEKIARIAPGKLKKSIILSTGAEANECAFRIAKAYTEKRGIVGFHKGYSGLTLATSNVGGNSQNTSLSLPGGFKIITPDCRHCSVQATYPECDILCLKVSEELIQTHCSDNIAAFIVEPILSSGGMIFPPPGYFARLKGLAERLGALLITDEAQTGMGRTGKWFGIELDNVEPDILVLSKGIGGGFPASAVVVSDEIAETILGRFSNFSSHQSDPLAAVAISSVIDIIKEENLIVRASETGAYFKKNLEQLSDQYPILENIRGKGLMIGMDARDFPDKGLTSTKCGQVFEYLCRQHGVHLKSIHNGKIFRILPPLTIKVDEVDKVIAKLEIVLKLIFSGKCDFKKTLPENPYVFKLKQIIDDKLTVRQMIKKGWQTSPEQVIAKIKKKIS